MRLIQKINMLTNLELEQRLLAGLIQYPSCYGEIENFITKDDFEGDENGITKVLFNAIKSFCQNAQDIDETILSERIKALGISFPQDIEIADYIHSLVLNKVSENKIVSIAKELKKISIRRELYEAAKNTALQMKSLSPESSFEKIIEVADQTFNRKIDLYDISDNGFSNIYEEMPDYIEDLGNNPKDQMGLMGPFETVNDLYGSLLRPGNITVIVARSGVGKTRFCMDYCTKIAKIHKVPVLHFDNGEMSKDELIIRQCSALSGVSSHLLETGQWRLAGEDVVNRVRSVWEEVKNLKFYYYPVGGYGTDKMVALLKRFYFSKVGRGKKMVFSFDYIKPTDEVGKSEWQSVGSMVDNFKRTIQREILCDGKPVIPMLTSVQSNRSGIVTNKQSRDVNDDEGIVSLSDRVIQYSSHLFILRAKTLDELSEEQQRFGTHKLIPLKTRHLGKLSKRATTPILMPDARTVNNCVHLNMEGFNVDCMGDQKDLKGFLETSAQIQDDLDRGNPPDDFPSLD
ncbi:hypothetical protein OAL45_00170 [bacterium]|nr:hypothetical protein [bacterium]MDB4744127.1 hypothetical protein [Verrucomicrobiota bacterium]MDC0317850.1 hypothetical protein [bacterium]